MQSKCKYSSPKYFECQAHHQPWVHLCDIGLEEAVKEAEAESFLKGKKSGWDDCMKYYNIKESQAEVRCICCVRVERQIKNITVRKITSRTPYCYRSYR